MICMPFKFALRSAVSRGGGGRGLGGMWGGVEMDRTPGVAGTCLLSTLRADVKANQ